MVERGRSARPGADWSRSRAAMFCHSSTRSESRLPGRDPGRSASRFKSTRDQLTAAASARRSDCSLPSVAHGARLQQRRQRHLRAIDEQLGKIRQRIGRSQLHGQRRDRRAGRQGRQQGTKSASTSSSTSGFNVRPSDFITRPRQGCRRSPLSTGSMWCVRASCQAGSL